MTDQDDTWLTIREAALAMNVSELTIRRRIKVGRIAHKMVDGKYYVNRAVQPFGSTDRPPAASDASSGPAHTSAEAMSNRPRPEIPLETILPEFGRLAERAGRAAVLQQRVEELSAENQSMRESLISLAGRNGWLESKLEEREKELRLLTDLRRKPSFWKRLFGATGEDTSD